VLLLSLLLAGLLEGIGIAALLPLLNIVLENSTGTESAISRYTQPLFDTVGLTPSLEAMLSMIVIVVVLKAGLLIFAARQIGYTAAFAAMLIRKNLLDALMQARWSFFARRRAGSLIAAISSEPTRASACFIQICRTLAGAIQVLVYVGLAVAISWEVSVAASLVGVISIVLLNRFVLIVGRAGQSQTAVNRSLLSQLIDGLHAMKPIKAMGREESLSRLLTDDIRMMNTLQRILISNKEALTHYRDPIATIALAGCIYLVLTFWDLEPERLFVMALLFLRITGRVSALQSSQQGVAASLPAFWFLRSVLSSAFVAKEERGTGFLPELRQQISLMNVTFAYGRKVILKNVNVTIPAGRFVAIVGPSGCGKTTLADIVIGLLKPQSGKVLIDETLMSAVDHTEWRRRIGYVPQDTVLFHDTIRNNVTLSDDTLPRSDVKEALILAGAWKFVEALPEGTETIVGERGTNLSGGQRQRIAIARALVKKPRLLILDEATTALDPETEAAICTTLRELRGQVTILSISHQPAMRDAADITYSMEDGHIRLETSSFQSNTLSVDQV
jgi:ATP-binding cassette subfamily C protein